jgi:hypothetical protein
VGCSWFWKHWERWESACSQTLEIRLLLGQASFDELALKIRELGFEQTSIPRDVVSVGAQPCQFFIDHRRHPLTVAKVFPLG